MLSAALYFTLLILCALSVSGLLKFSSNFKIATQRIHVKHYSHPVQNGFSGNNNVVLRGKALYMSSTGRSGGSGSTKLDRKTVQKTVTKPTYKEEIEKDWRLVLHDDTVHTIQQVCDIISASCPLCTGPRAYEVTLEVHMTGAGTVAVANKKIITEYTKSLQAAGLTVSMAPDDEFDSEGEGDGDGGGD